MLVIGTHIQQHEIDRYTYLGNVKFWVTCEWMLTQLNTTLAKIRRGTYLSDYGMFEVRLKPLELTVDGGQPRRFLSKPNTKYAVTPSGKRLLERNGKEIEGVEILNYLNNMGMQEAQNIADKFGVTQEVIDNVLFNLVEQGYAKGNRFFDLYNTKNMVNLRPAMKGAL